MEMVFLLMILLIAALSGTASLLFYIKDDYQRATFYAVLFCASQLNLLLVRG